MDVKVQRGVAIIPSNESEVIVKLDTPVNPEKAIVLFGGSIYGGYNYDDSGDWDTRLDLINGQHIKVKRAFPGLFPAEVSWQVLEFVKGVIDYAID